MNRLDQIEDIENGRAGNAVLLRSDVLALVAVARAARDMRRHPGMFHNADAQAAIDRLDSALAPLVANRTPSPCAWCEGMGVVNTGIDESPVTQCNRCDGTGLKSAGTLQRENT